MQDPRSDVRVDRPLRGDEGSCCHPRSAGLHDHGHERSRPALRHARPRRICGLGGNDVLDGQGANDVLIGGPGADQLNGGDGNDVLYGGPGNDKLQGDAGSDSVYGGDGRDVIWAWDGFADRLNGGAGMDRA